MNGELITTYQPNVGDEVELTEACAPMGLKVGDSIKVVDYKDGMVCFDVPNHSMRGWTSKFGQKRKSCTCSMNDLLIRGCACGGQ